MVEYGEINYSTEEINNRLSNALLKTEQVLTDEEKQQVRANLGTITYEEYKEEQ